MPSSPWESRLPIVASRPHSGSLPSTPNDTDETKIIFPLSRTPTLNDLPTTESLDNKFSALSSSEIKTARNQSQYKRSSEGEQPVEEKLASSSNEDIISTPREMQSNSHSRKKFWTLKARDSVKNPITVVKNPIYGMDISTIRKGIKVETSL